LSDNSAKFGLEVLNSEVYFSG